MMVQVCSLSMGTPPRRVYSIVAGLDLFGVPFIEQEFGPVFGRKTVRVRRFDTIEQRDLAAVRLGRAAVKRGYEPE